MRKHLPVIVSKDLTRFTEAQLDQIESGKIKSTTVLEDAIEKWNETLPSFKK